MTQETAEDAEYLLRTITFEFDPDLRCESSALKKALAIWNEARGARAMPARRDIDPLTLPRDLLPHLMLIDVLREPAPRFRWRLIGTGITRVLGRDSTGQYWDELYEPRILSEIGGAALWVLEHGRPLRSIGHAPLPERSFLQSENLNMPLSSDGDAIDMIFAVSIYG